MCNNSLITSNLNFPPVTCKTVAYNTRWTQLVVQILNLTVHVKFKSSGDELDIKGKEGEGLVGAQNGNKQH